MSIKAIRNKIKKVGLKKKINELLDFTTINDDAITSEDDKKYVVSIADNSVVALALGELLTSVKGILVPTGSNKDNSYKYCEKLLKAIDRFRHFIKLKISQKGDGEYFKLKYESCDEFDGVNIENLQLAEDWGIPCRQKLVERNYIYYFLGKDITDFFQNFVKSSVDIVKVKEELENKVKDQRGAGQMETAIRILQAELDNGNVEELKKAVEELSKCDLYKDGSVNVSKNNVSKFIGKSKLRLAKIYRVCNQVKEFSSTGGSKNSDSSESLEAEKSKKGKKQEQDNEAKDTDWKYRNEMYEKYFYFSDDEIDNLEKLVEEKGGTPVDLNELLYFNEEKVKELKNKGFDNLDISQEREFVKTLLELGNKLKAVKDAVDVKTCNRGKVKNCIETISKYNDNNEASAKYSVNEIGNESIRYRIRKFKRAIFIAMVFLLIGTIAVSLLSPLIKFNHLGRSFVYSTQSGEFEFRKYDNSGAEIISAVPLSEDGTVEFPSQVALDDSGLFKKKNVVAIGANVFGEEAEKNFTAVFIPKSITHIDSNAFDGCNNITLYCEASEKPDGYEDGWSGYNPIIWGVDIEDKIEEVIQADMKFILKEADKTATLMGFDGAGKENLEIPSEVKLDNKSYTVTVISALGENPELKSIAAPDSVIKIEKGAFAGCTNLESITLPFVGAELNGTTSTHFGYIFGAGGDKENVDKVPGTLSSITISGGKVAANAFSGCSIDGSIVFEQKVTAIAQGALNDCDVNSLTLPFLGENGSDISHAFLGYIFGATTYDQNGRLVPESLKQVTITANKIGDYAFANCSSLEKILVSDGIQEIGCNVFEGCNEAIYNTDTQGAKYIDGISSIRLILVDGTNVSGAYTPNANTRVIANNAFEGCTELSGITIPQDVVMIGDNAFAGCTEITEMVIPNNVQSIGADAFSDCSGLEGSITIPDSVTSMGSGTFSGCSSLTSITIPDSVTSIKDRTFLECSRMESITLGNDVTSIGSYAFSKCTSLAGIDIPNSVKSIGAYAFSDCSNLSGKIEIPYGVTSIEEGVFYNCGNLTHITIPDSVTVIGSSAFRGCSELISIPIPTVVTSIGAYAFFGCSNLSGKIEIPYKVTSIEEKVFYNCSNLTHITIPDSVTVIGDSAFFGCSSLESIIIPFIGAELNGTTNTHFGYLFGAPSYSDNSDYAPSTLKEVVIIGGTTIGDYAFYNCRGLTSITIPDSVTTIGGNAFFGCSSLERMIIPFIGAELNGTANTHFGHIFGATSYSDNSDYVPSTLKEVVIIGGTSIEGRAFYNCRGLTSIVIPNSVTSIGEGAFSGCSGLESITIPFVGGSIKTASDIYQYPFGYIFGTSSYMGGVRTRQYYYGSSTSSRTSTDYYIPASLESVTVTGGNILYGAFDDCSGLTSIIIPNSVTSIGDHAFDNCSGLTSITIPDSVTSIGDYAFSDCSGLTSITIPDSVTSIGDRAFQNCSGLTSITIGDSVTSIEENAFIYCSGIIRTENGVSYVDKWVIDCDNEVRQVRLRDDTVGIADRAFYNCSSLTSITIPDSVTSIGDYAFYNCSGLTNINISDGITSIGDDAFYNCSGLTSINIPDSVTSIGDGAFSNCSGLTNITIPDGVTSIGDGAFSNCSGLTNITIPDGVTSIGDYAFSNCSGLTNITIPDGVTSIGDYAFYYCRGLTNITIPDSVISIGVWAFWNCHNMKSVVIGDGVAKIEEGTFSGCSLTNVIIGRNVTSIGNMAFQGCRATSITIPDSVTNIGNGAFYFCENLTSITIPDGVTSIGEQVFYNCSGLTNINIPDSVTSIGDSAFYNCSGLTNINISDGVTSIGDDAFYYCSGLTSITIPDSVTSIGDSVFAGCNALTIYCELTSEPSGWSDSWNYSNCPVVWNCNNNEADNEGNIYYIADNGIRYALNNGTATVIRQIVTLSEEIIIPAEITYKDVAYSVTTINASAFYNCRGLTSITIPDSVTSIGESAFSGCSGLTSITIPDSVTSIGDHVFALCAALTIYCETASKPSGWSNYWKDSCPVVWNCNNNEADNEGNIYYIADNGIRYALNNGTATVIRQIVTLSEEIIIPAEITYKDVAYSVTTINASAFYNCRGLTSITIPDSVTSIGDEAFYKCSGLTSVILGNSVTRIGEYAFGGCSSLMRITIPDSVTNIGDWAFDNCSGLISITIGNGVTNIGDWAFSNCSGLTNITIPDSVTSIGKGAFRYCSSLKSVTIPDSVTSIGGGAFSWCSSLKSVTIPDSVTSIGGGAFSGCSGLISITIEQGNPIYHSVGNCLIETASKTLMAGCKNSVIPIDGSVTSIGESAFRGCNGLTSITIPDSVTSIGGGAFSGCSGLTSVTIPDSVKSVGAEAFRNCDSLTSITIPDSVTSIGSFTFQECSRLTIYCEATSKPSGWSSSWNYSNCPVVWGYKGN